MLVVVSTAIMSLQTMLLNIVSMESALIEAVSKLFLLYFVGFNILAYHFRLLVYDGIHQILCTSNLRYSGFSEHKCLWETSLWLKWSAFKFHPSSVFSGFHDDFSTI